MQLPFNHGSILLTGFESNMQAIVARQYAMERLANGGSVIALVDRDGDGREQTVAFADAMRSHEIDRAALDRLHIFEGTYNYSDGAKLVAALKAKPWYRDGALIVRDVASAMTELLPDASWLPMANEIALLLDTRLLTVAHHGRNGPFAPTYSDYQADEVWTATAGLNLALTLKRIKPSEIIIHLKGAMLPFNTIGFENIEEVAHDFA